MQQTFFKDLKLVLHCCVDLGHLAAQKELGTYCNPTWRDWARCWLEIAGVHAGSCSLVLAPHCAGGDFIDCCLDAVGISFGLLPVSEVEGGNVQWRRGCGGVPVLCRARRPPRRWLASASLAAVERVNQLIPWPCWLCMRCGGAGVAAAVGVVLLSGRFGCELRSKLLDAEA